MFPPPRVTVTSLPHLSSYLQWGGTGKTTLSSQTGKSRDVVIRVDERKNFIKLGNVNFDIINPGAHPASCKMGNGFVSRG